MMLDLETDKPTLSAPKLKNLCYTRTASKYFSHLSDFIIPVTQLRLIETIGQGIVEHIMDTVDLNNHYIFNM